MKKLIILSALAVCMTSGMNAQDIPQSAVPTIIINAFNQQYPKAMDIDWEMDGSNYKVEFEIWFRDHEVWYDNSGKVIRTKEEISSSDLPAAISSAIQSNYNGFRTDDCEKWTEGSTTHYVIELKTFTQERKVVFDASGKVLSDIAD